MSYVVFNDDCNIDVVKGEDGLVHIYLAESNLIFRLNVKYIDDYRNRKRGKEYYIINSRDSKGFSKRVRSKLKELKVSSKIDSYTLPHMNGKIYNLKLSKDNYIKLKTLLKIHNGEIVL